MKCEFCSRVCKNSNSLRNHQRLCKFNENRQMTHFSSDDFQNNRNPSNQYIKAEYMGLPKPEVAPETRAIMRDLAVARPKEWYTAIGKKSSKTIKEKVARGEWHTSLAKNMHVSYKGVDLHGSWELKYAIFLDDNNIRWIRNTDSFSYEFEQKQRRYTPDFYLPDTDEYVEIKGYRTEKDTAKWEQFPRHRKLTVLMEKELKDMGIL